MSDPLSVAASVIGVAQLGCTVAKGLYQIADEIGMAGLEVRLHAQEVDGFSKLLVRLQHTIEDLDLKSRRHEIDEIRSHIGEVLGICQKTLQPMKDEIDRSLQPLLVRFHDSPAKFVQVALRIRWCFVSKGKIMFWREFLQAQHRMLDTTLLQAIYLSNSAARSTETTSMLRDSLENSYTSLSKPTLKVGSVHGNLLLAPPPGSSPRVSLSSKTDVSQANQAQDGSTFDCFEGQHESNEDMSLALLEAPPPMPEPDLFNMTDEEIRAIKTATSIEIDGPTGRNMTQILIQTEAAEKRTLEMVTTTLHGDKEKPSRDVKATRNHISSSVVWDLCGPDQIGPWSLSRRRVFRPSKMRFEIQYEAPVFFLCPPTNRRGPLPKTEVLYVRGTPESEVFTKSLSAEEAKMMAESVIRFSRTSRSKRPSPPTAARGKASWLILLGEFHKMERSTRNWQQRELKENIARAGPRPNLPDQVAGWESYSHVVALQPHRQSWDALPTSSIRPYATTTFSDLIDMTAMLGLYWKAFDQARSIYFAEGNGYSLSGRREPGFGMVFEFSITSSRNEFEARRLIPTKDIRAMACGYVQDCMYSAPTGQRRPSRPSSPPYGSEVIYMGRRNSVSDLLASLGCEKGLLDAMSSQDNQQSHLFPVAFEIIGMIAKVSYISNSYLRRLPNPTPFIWDRQNFSVRKLILQFHRSLADDDRIPETPCIVELQKWAYNVAQAAVRSSRAPDSETLRCLDTFSVLEHAIERCDRYFASEGPDLRNLILRLHFNEVLRFLSEPMGQQTDSANRGYHDTNAHTDVSNYERLMSAGPETRHAVLMDVYFSIILPRVAKAFSQDFGRANQFEKDLATAGWCTLVLRMLCWLLLHDFDKEDVQIADLSKIYGNETSVYIC